VAHRIDEVDVTSEDPERQRQDHDVEELGQPHLMAHGQLKSSRGAAECNASARCLLQTMKAALTAQDVGSSFKSALVAHALSFRNITSVQHQCASQSEACERRGQRHRTKHWRSGGIGRYQNGCWAPRHELQQSLLSRPHHRPLLRHCRGLRVCRHRYAALLPAARRAIPTTPIDPHTPLRVGRWHACRYTGQEQHTMC